MCQPSCADIIIIMIQWQWTPSNLATMQHFDSFVNGQKHRYSHIYLYYGHIKFINIQKNASTSFRHMLEYPLKKLQEDYYCAILRDPLQRMKSIFYYNNEQKNWSVDRQGSELIKPKNFLNDYQQFCHFLPQSMHIKPFEHKDIDYFSMVDIPKLVKKLLKKMPRLIHNDKQTNPSQALIEQVNEWLYNHRSFVDDFLGPDIELYNNKIKLKAPIVESSKKVLRLLHH